MRRLATIVLPLVLIGGISVLATVAFAHKKVFSSTIEFVADLPFHGTVQSENGRCEGGRKVKLIQEKPNENEIVAEVTTAADGTWTTDVDDDNHPHYAVVARPRGCS
jgi:hypothetical protein